MKHKQVLLIEDDYLDIESVKRSLKKLKVDHELFVAHNGVDALALLNGTNDEGKKINPDIIFLDINMPKMNGIEFLQIIKNYYSLKNIKVFIMTTSSEEYDKIASQNLGVAGYIIKPLDFEKALSAGTDTFKLKEELLK
jgi:CheY-like chemotaxis protein